MARSLKKGPFVDSHLMGRIEELNRKNEKKIFQTDMDQIDFMLMQYLEK